MKSCTYAALGFLQYRLKSPMLFAMVDQTPIEAVVADMNAMNRLLPAGARTLDQPSAGSKTRCSLMGQLTLPAA